MSDSALNPPTAGTAVEFEAGTTTGPISAIFDFYKQSVMIAYTDGGAILIKAKAIRHGVWNVHIVWHCG